MKFYYVLIFFITILLTGCGPIYQTSYSYQAPDSQQGKMCIAQCLSIKNSCQNMCQMQDQNCRLRNHQRAFYQYQIYSSKQREQGKPVTLSVEDFDNSVEDCSHSCSCGSEFNFCYQKCGGKILAHKECTAFCK